MADPLWVTDEIFECGCDFYEAIRYGNLDKACAAYNRIIEWYPDEQR